MVCPGELFAPVRSALFLHVGDLLWENRGWAIRAARKHQRECQAHGHALGTSTGMLPPGKTLCQKVKVLPGLDILLHLNLVWDCVCTFNPLILGYKDLICHGFKISWFSFSFPCWIPDFFAPFLRLASTMKKLWMSAWTVSLTRRSLLRSSQTSPPST